MLHRLKTNVKETKDILFYKGGEMGQELAQIGMWITIILSIISIGFALSLFFIEPYQ